MRSFLIVIGMLASTTAFARVDCVGIPQATKVGDFGGQEGYLMVVVNNLDFRLGAVDDQGAKSRLAIAAAALTASKPLLLRFYDPYTDCATASTSRIIPNSTQLLQQ